MTRTRPVKPKPFSFVMEYGGRTIETSGKLSFFESDGRFTAVIDERKSRHTASGDSEWEAVMEAVLLKIMCEKDADAFKKSLDSKSTMR